MRGRPDKNVYAITPEGRKELLRWLSDVNPSLSPHNAILMKVFFLGERSREENIRYFEEYKKNCEAFLESMDAAAKHMEEYRVVLDDPEKALYWAMTADYGRWSTEAEIDWAQRCIERLKENL